MWDFCVNTVNKVAPASDPISKTYDGGENTQIRLTLSWDGEQGIICPASQIPSQNAGRDCNTIYHDIIGGCKYIPTSIIQETWGILRCIMEV